MLEKNDWRIMGQDCYIAGRKFKKNVYHLYRPGWDHDHCIYCTEKFMEKNITGKEIQEGYSTLDEGLWVCPACYEDFKDYFKMPLVVNTVEMVENALREQKTVIFSYNNERYIIKNKENKISVLHNESEKLYEDVLTMERSQRFYGKPLRDVMEDLYMSIV